MMSFLVNSTKRLRSLLFPSKNASKLLHLSATDGRNLPIWTQSIYADAMGAIVRMHSPAQNKILTSSTCTSVLFSQIKRHTLMRSAPRKHFL
jgi:hypothetical protein